MTAHWTNSTSTKVFSSTPASSVLSNRRSRSTALRRLRSTTYHRSTTRLWPNFESASLALQYPATAMLVSSVALGGIAGLLLRGDWRNLRDVRISWWPLALLALALRVLAVAVGLPVWIHVVAILLVVGIA